MADITLCALTPKDQASIHAPKHTPGMPGLEQPPAPEGCDRSREQAGHCRALPQGFGLPPSLSLFWYLQKCLLALKWIKKCPKSLQLL